MIILYFPSWKSKSRMLQLIKRGNKGEKQSWEEKNDSHFPLCWIPYWSVFSLQTQSSFAHTHDYMTVPKMCIYDKDHFISSYKTANAVNNLAKIKKTKLSFSFPLEHGKKIAITCWEYSIFHFLLISHSSFGNLSAQTDKPCSVEPHQMDRSWWRGLTECGPLEKGMANHFNIPALRTTWTVLKCKMIG